MRKWIQAAVELFKAFTHFHCIPKIFSVSEDKINQTIFTLKSWNQAKQLICFQNPWWLTAAVSSTHRAVRGWCILSAGRSRGSTRCDPPRGRRPWTDNQCEGPGGEPGTHSPDRCRRPRTGSPRCQTAGTAAGNLPLRSPRPPDAHTQQQHRCWTCLIHLSKLFYSSLLFWPYTSGPGCRPVSPAALRSGRAGVRRRSRDATLAPSGDPAGSRPAGPKHSARPPALVPLEDWKTHRTS